MNAAEHAHIGPLHSRLVPSLSSYYISNTPPSLVRARSSSAHYTGASSVSSAPTTSSVDTTTSPSRDRSAAAHLGTTTGRASSDFSSSSYIVRLQDQPAVCLLHTSAENHLWIGVSATPRVREFRSPPIVALSRTYSFVLLPFPLTMLLELPLEFLLRIYILVWRIELSIFSFGFGLLSS